MANHGEGWRVNHPKVTFVESKPRVIFVGMNNKLGMSPLDSRSRSGKTIDKVIAHLEGFDCIKSNLYDSLSWPYWLPADPKAAPKWAERVGFTQRDIAVLLGKDVQGRFSFYSSVEGYKRFVQVAHPAARKVSADEIKYINETAVSILITIKILQA